MKKWLQKFLLPALALSCHSIGIAEVVRVDFTASEFGPFLPPTYVPPIAEVSGSFTYEVLPGDIRLLSQDVMVGEHRFAFDDVGIFQLDKHSFFGAKIGFDETTKGPGDIVTDTNDFRLQWDVNTNTVQTFMYTVPTPGANNMIWSARAISYRFQSISPVPEPKSMALGTLGLVAVSAALSRKKLRQSST